MIISRLVDVLTGGNSTIWRVHTVGKNQYGNRNYRFCRGYTSLLKAMSDASDLRRMGMPVRIELVRL